MNTVKCFRITFGDVTVNVTIGRISDHSVPQWGIKPQPLANRASIILLDYQDTDHCHSDTKLTMRRQFDYVFRCSILHSST